MRGFTARSRALAVFRCSGENAPSRPQPTSRQGLRASVARGASARPRTTVYVLRQAENCFEASGVWQRQRGHTNGIVKADGKCLVAPSGPRRAADRLQLHESSDPSGEEPGGLCFADTADKWRGECEMLQLTTRCWNCARLWLPGIRGSELLALVSQPSVTSPDLSRLQDDQRPTAARWFHIMTTLLRTRALLKSVYPHKPLRGPLVHRLNLYHRILTRSITSTSTCLKLENAHV
jgi:hypothetical protein